MLILDTNKIKQKVKRLSFEIIENNYDAEDITLIGINNTGLKFANLLHLELNKLKPNKVHVEQIKIDPKNPAGNPELKFDIESIEDKVVILVDDVANTGRTLFYLFRPFMNAHPKKIEVAVLVNREHKLFPIKVDYVGMSLATTLMDNIKVSLEEDAMQATLE